MSASPLLAAVLAERLQVAPMTVGTPARALNAAWDVELPLAAPELRRLAQRYDEIFARGETPVTALSRCSVALATLPRVAAHRPDALVVWFDAHADLNTPETTTSGYLGGLALSGPLGLWDSGLGDGLSGANAVLVGTRDLDPPEQCLVDDGLVDLVPVGPHMHDRLRQRIAGRPVYVHIDCDVLEPHVVPTDYLVPDGMTLEQLRACAEVLAESEVVGIEVGELEADEGSRDAGPAGLVLDALEPLFQSLERS